MAEAPPRADLLDRKAAENLLELGGEFFVRLTRLVQVYLGVDPQQLSSVPRYQLAKYVVPAILAADATAPPWRKVGKAYQTAQARPAVGGNTSGVIVSVRPSAPVIAVVDWVDLDASAASRFQYGYTALGNPTANPAAIALEERPQAPKSTNFTVAGVPTYSQIDVADGGGVALVDGSTFQMLGLGATGPGLTTRVDFRGANGYGEVCLWPGVGFVLQDLLVNTAVDVTVHLRVFDLSQVGSQQNFAV